LCVKCCSVGALQGDIIAGLTVALTVIPQGLAYASVAQLPPQVRFPQVCQRWQNLKVKWTN